MKTYAGSDIEVAVLTRDRTRLLKEALDSLAAQTVEGLKITVYDNAGTEDSGAVVSALRAETRHWTSRISGTKKTSASTAILRMPSTVRAAIS